MTTYNPRTDKNKTGANCSGTDGQTNRTYTLAFANSIEAGMNVYVGL